MNQYSAELRCDYPGCGRVGHTIDDSGRVLCRSCRSFLTGEVQYGLGLVAWLRRVVLRRSR